MSKEKVIEMLKSGNFTIVYWDSDEPTLYQKKWDKEEEQERDDYETMNRFVVNIEDSNNGYCNPLMELLVEALGGNIDSI